MSATQTQTQTETETRQALAPQQLRAEIVYLSREVEKPYQYLCEPPAGEPINNFKRVPVQVAMSDVSTLTAEERVARGFTTTEAGFEFVKGWGKEATAGEWRAEKWDDDGWMRSAYYSDVDALLKKHLGVTSTFIFDHTVRKSQTAHTRDDAENRKPVSQAHCDQSRWAGENRIRKHLGDDVLARVRAGDVHVQLINVWRPLRGPVEEHPLAVADSRTVSRGGAGAGAQPDWRASELRYADWTGETLLIHPNAAHRWYYYRHIDVDHAILLKCYDSETDTRTPHTAFVDPTTPRGAKPRWSVEVRVLAVTDRKRKQ